MFSRFTALLLALVMGVPLCWCCRAAEPAAVAVQEETCSACKYHDAEQDAPETPADSHGERRCCAKFNVRNLSPDVAAAPRLVLVDLQAWVWMRTDFLVTPDWADLIDAPLVAAQTQARHGPPLYQRHCALLI